MMNKRINILEILIVTFLILFTCGCGNSGESSPSVEVTKEVFVLSDEVKNASFEDFVLQIDDVVWCLKGNDRMELIFDKIEGSTCNYTTSMNRDSLVSPEEQVYIIVYKDGVERFRFCAKNWDTEIRELEECQMCGFDMTNCDYSNIWLPQGICADGSNVNYDNILSYIGEYPYMDSVETTECGYGVTDYSDYYYYNLHLWHQGDLTSRTIDYNFEISKTTRNCIRAYVNYNSLFVTVTITDQGYEEQEEEYCLEQNEEENSKSVECVELPNWYVVNGVAVKGNELCFSRDDGLEMENGEYPLTVEHYVFDDSGRLYSMKEYIIFEDELTASQYADELNSYNNEGENDFGMQMGEARYYSVGNILVEEYLPQYTQYNVGTLQDEITMFSEYGWSIEYV